MKTPKINPAAHLKNLIYFNFNRFKGDNYSKMREYFADVFLCDIGRFSSLKNKKILDIGGANGEFCRAINKKVNCDIINLDPFPQKIVWKKTIKGFADKIPFKGNTFDVVLSRGVFEHIPYNKQQTSLNESYRVLKKGGLSYFVIPPWFNPHAGHGFKPFHVFPFRVAKFLKESISRKKIEPMFSKNKMDFKSYEEYLLFKITFNKMERMIKKSGFHIIDTLDTHFRMHFLTKIPGLREIFVPAVAFIVKK